jgi:uncharacterized protein (TIGR00369 family)
MSAFVASAETDEFRSVAGLKWIDSGGGRLEQAMVVTDAMSEPDGAAAAGAVAILADSTLGTAAAATKDGSQGIVTLGLHADLTGELPGRGGTMTMQSERVHLDGGLVWVSGLVTSGREVIGLVTWRGLFVDFARRHARLRMESRAIPAPDLGGARPLAGDGDGRPVRSVDDALGLEVHHSSGGELRLISQPPGQFASGWRTLHGGVVALLGHRAARHAADGIAMGTGAIRPLGLDVEFFRPLPGSTSVVATGSVVHQGRSYVTTEGRVFLDDGRLAAIVRMTGALGLT